MKGTRTAAPGSPFRQERYCSSPELNQGLMAGMVAKRCAVLLDPLDRELIYFLQYLSHQTGLARLAEGMLSRYPEQMATTAMQEIGLTGNYSADQVRAVRKEIPQGCDPFVWEERKARLAEEAEHARWLGDLSAGREDYTPERAERQAAAPVPAKRFVELCRTAAAELPEYLRELCLDPKVPVDAGPWYFPGLISHLRAYMEEWQLEHEARIVSTEVARRVIDTLEYTRQTRCLTLCEGIEGLGKTWSAQNVCRQRPGLWRYVQVPATDDECGFYREIAKALGVSININSKAREYRERIEDVMQAGDLGLVLDEAHWLFGINGLRGGLPKRMLWVLTALVNKGVPVAMVATPQWETNRKFVQKHTRWRDEQLMGRIGHREILPEVLAVEELTEVVRANLPAADARSVTAIVDYARNKGRSLGVLSAIVTRAKFIAGKSGRKIPGREDIAAAIRQHGIQGMAPAPQPQCSEPAAALPRRGRNVPVPAAPADVDEADEPVSPRRAPALAGH